MQRKSLVCFSAWTNAFSVTINVDPTEHGIWSNPHGGPGPVTVPIECSARIEQPEEKVRVFVTFVRVWRIIFTRPNVPSGQVSVRIIDANVLVEIGLVQRVKGPSRIVDISLSPIGSEGTEKIEPIIHDAYVIRLTVNFVVATMMKSQVVTQLVHE